MVKAILDLMILLSGIWVGIDHAALPVPAETASIVYQIQADEIDNDLRNAVMAMLRSRLDDMGYPEAELQISSENKVIVLIPEIENAAEIAASLAANAKLTFEDAQGNILLTGQDIKKASVQRPDSGSESSGGTDYTIMLEFTEEGADKFSEATARAAELPAGENVINIVLDETLISAPQVSEAIQSDTCIISGGFDEASAKELVQIIQSARLPCTLELVSVNGPG